MSFGFFAAGSAGNMIISDDYPVLRRVFTGEIRVTHPHNGSYLYGGYVPTFAYCVVNFPAPIGTRAPPLVFASPDGSFESHGLAAFMPLGSPGRWTGFRVVHQDGRPVTTVRGSREPLPIKSGTYTGWRYHVCVHEPEAASKGQGFGLRLFNAGGEIIFDSNWPIVPFRGLLQGWVLDKAFRPSRWASWGNEQANQQKDLDIVRQWYRHPWGALDGTRGVLISSLSGLEIVGDNGYDDRVPYTLPPALVFDRGERANIYCLIDAGLWQHPTIEPRAMSRFALLTCDLSLL